MQNVFQQEYEISAIHVDCLGNVKPSCLLYFAQEAATGHCDILHLDWDTMAEKKLFWAVIRTKVEITRIPRLGEKILVRTWPMPTTRTAYPRAVSICDPEGNELVRILSLWVLMNTETRAMVLPGRSGVDVEGIAYGTETTPPGSLVPKASDMSLCRQVVFSELDRNGHMNNTRYMDWVDDLLGAEFHKANTLKGFTICYLSEALEGHTVELKYNPAENGVFQVDGYDTQTDASDKKTRIFSAEVQF